MTSTLEDEWVVVTTKGLIETFKTQCDQFFSVFKNMEFDNAIDCQYDLVSTEEVFVQKYTDLFGRKPPGGLFLNELRKRCKPPSRTEDEDDY
jgi:hypothetical protein